MSSERHVSKREAVEYIRRKSEALVELGIIDAEMVFERLDEAERLLRECYALRWDGMDADLMNRVEEFLK